MIRESLEASRRVEGMREIYNRQGYLFLSDFEAEDELRFMLPPAEIEGIPFAGPRVLMAILRADKHTAWVQLDNYGANPESIMDKEVV